MLVATTGPPPPPPQPAQLPPPVDALRNTFVSVDHHATRLAALWRGSIARVERRKRDSMRLNLTLQPTPEAMVQAAGHAGTFTRKADGVIVKEAIVKEAKNYEEISALHELLCGRPFASWLPRFHGSSVRGAIAHIELGDVTAGLRSPCVMDIKMGTRTFLEAELGNSKRRLDLRDKVNKADPTALSAEEQKLGVCRKELEPRTSRFAPVRCTRSGPISCTDHQAALPLLAGWCLFERLARLPHRGHPQGGCQVRGRRPIRSSDRGLMHSRLCCHSHVPAYASGQCNLVRELPAMSAALRWFLGGLSQAILRTAFLAKLQALRADLAASRSAGEGTPVWPLLGQRPQGFDRGHASQRTPQPQQIGACLSCLSP